MQDITKNKNTFNQKYFNHLDFFLLSIYKYIIYFFKDDKIFMFKEIL